MKFLALFSITILFLFSCQTKDAQFCDCMNVSNQFNDVSKEILKKGQSPNLEKTFKDLKLKKEQACKNYLEMSGKEMLEKKAACQN